MAKSRVTFTLLTTGAAAGAVLVAAIDTLLASKAIFIRDSPVATIQNDAGNWTVVGDVRFDSTVDAATFSTELQTLMTTDLTVLAGSKRNQHVCPHEGDRRTWYDCRSDTRAGYAEATK